MKRIVFNFEQLKRLTSPELGKPWLLHASFADISQVAYPDFRGRFWEVVYRRNREFVSHKTVPLFIPEALAAKVSARGLLTAEEFFKVFAAVQSSAALLLLRAVRPYTYLPWQDDGQPTGFSENWQLELPGGQVGEKENGEAAIQELVEEAGIGAEQILCWAPAYFSPSANDGGTHMERYGLWYVLCTGTPHPPTDKKDPERYREGIVGFDAVPVDEVGAFLKESAEHGIPIELFVHTGAFALAANLRRAQ